MEIHRHTWSSGVGISEEFQSWGFFCLSEELPIGKVETFLYGCLSFGIYTNDQHLFILMLLEHPRSCFFVVHIVGLLKLLYKCLEGLL